MTIFGTRGRPDLVHAADAADRVDSQVSDMYGLLEVASGALSEVEYDAIVAEFEGVVAPVRTLRQDLDDLLDNDSREPDLFRTVGEALVGCETQLASVREALSQYADARGLCERTSGELLAEVARLERAAGSNPDPRWLQATTWAREELNAAALQAQGRNWLAAHRLLCGALGRLRDIDAEVSSARSSEDARRAQVSSLAGSAIALRDKGAAAAAVFGRLEAKSPADAAPHRSVIVTAGAVLREVTGAVATLNSDIHDPSWPADTLDDLVARTQTALESLEVVLDRLALIEGNHPR